MDFLPNSPRRTAGWHGIRRGHQARTLERLAEWVIYAVSLSAVALIFLIFLFVGREAWPVLIQAPSVNSAALQEVLPAEQLAQLPRARIQSYLGLTASQMASMDAETLRDLMLVREEALQSLPQELRTDPDAKLNTARWPLMILPHQWSGYSRPEYIWQPIGSIHKYNLVPLLVGSLKTSLIGLAFAVPLALGAAIYVSQLAPPGLKEWLKPGIELLSGIPSVVMGSFALIVMASFLQKILGYETRLNAFVAGIALGTAVIPLVFSIAEDALTSVPRGCVQAALALGASKWEAAWQIVLPAALPGVFAGVVLGFGRAVGETMIVLLVCSASVMSWSIFDSARSITTTIAAEMAEAVAGSHHYRILFLLGAMLFAFTFVINLLGDLVIHRLKRRLEGK